MKLLDTSQHDEYPAFLSLNQIYMHSQAISMAESNSPDECGKKVDISAAWLSKSLRTPTTPKNLKGFHKLFTNFQVKESL